MNKTSPFPGTFLESLRDVEVLPPRQAIVTKLWHRGVTMKGCGEALGVTTERVRQILAKSRRTMQQHYRPLALSALVTETLALGLVSHPVHWPVQATWKTVYRPDSETPREPPPGWLEAQT